jgi:hypothetical protein
MFHSFVIWLDCHAGAIQAVSAVGILVLTFLLAATTVRYANATDEALTLSRTQFGEMTRVEVYLRLRTVPKIPGELLPIRYLAKLEMANLSGRGIWWDGITVTATVGITKSDPVVRPVEKIIPAYEARDIDCSKVFHDAAVSALGRPGAQAQGRVS